MDDGKSELLVPPDETRTDRQRHNRYQILLEIVCLILSVIAQTCQIYQLELSQMSTLQTVPKQQTFLLIKCVVNNSEGEFGALVCISEEYSHSFVYLFVCAVFGKDVVSEAITKQDEQRYDKKYS